MPYKIIGNKTPHDNFGFLKKENILLWNIKIISVMVIATPIANNIDIAPICSTFINNIDNPIVKN